MDGYSITYYRTSDVFRQMYEGSAWTWVGLMFNDDTARSIIEDFEEAGIVSEDCKTFEFFVTKGEHMNREYGLTGNNAYKDDLTIVSIPLECLGGGFVLQKLVYGARWFDDIVENNRFREENNGR